MRFESSIPQIANDFQNNDDFIVTSKVFTFMISQQMFEILKVDGTKCDTHKKTNY